MSNQPIDRRDVLKAAAASGIAAAGFAGNAAGHDLPNTIAIKARGEFVRYRFEVSDRLERGPAAEDSDDVLDNERAEGAVAGNGMDDFRFSGKITEFDVDGPVTVLVNGEKVDPEDLGEPDLPNKILLKGLSETDVKVRIEVSGEIAKGSRAGGTDTIKDDNVAIARITTKNNRDSFRFSGNIVEFEVLQGDVRGTFTVEGGDP